MSKKRELLVGDLAPALDLESFLKGEPFERFEPGKTYVVEFWATWCGPCRSSIPHLSALQRQYRNIPILGIVVAWKSRPDVVEFIEVQGAGISYRIALDSPGEPGARYSRTRSAWCEAGYQRGVPSAFIVDVGGRIAWMGHPLELDAPLLAITSGEWDQAHQTDAHMRWQKPRKPASHNRWSTAWRTTSPLAVDPTPFRFTVTRSAFIRSLRGHIASRI